MTLPQETTPAAIIHERATGGIDTAQMMDQLLKLPQSREGGSCPDGIAPADAASAASDDWDDIELAFYCGLLSVGEFETLAARHSDGAAPP